MFDWELIRHVSGVVVTLVAGCEWFRDGVCVIDSPKTEFDKLPSNRRFTNVNVFFFASRFLVCCGIFYKYISLRYVSLYSCTLKLKEIY